MDSKEREEFLASVEAEEDWLDRVSRRLSLPGGISSPQSQPKLPPPASAGPTTRATRKRRLSQPRAKDMADEQPSKKASRDDQALLDKLEQMIGSVRTDIAKSESNTAALIDGKLDSLSDNLSGRLDGAESSISTLTSDIVTLRRDVSDIKRKSDVQARSLTSVVEDIVTRKMRVLPSQTPQTSTTTTGQQQHGGTFTSKYWAARKSLRIWPVPGPDRTKNLVMFLRDKLRIPEGRIAPEEFTVTPIESSGNMADQVLVSFDTVRLRDEVKSFAKNLAGTDRAVGIQMEAPDHLRSHYQSFQKLGYNIKLKHPTLRRNVRFDDVNMALVMDVKLTESSDWKTIDYPAAKQLLKKVKNTTVVGRAELEEMVNLASPIKPRQNENAISDSDSDEDYSDAVVVPDDNNTDNCSSRFLSFINTNARSLLPKLDSLCDCMFEKGCDFALITETWLQDNRMTDECLTECVNRYAVGIISRNRSICATNNRQYGGVSVIFRRKTTSLTAFPLINPNEHEVVAAVGKVSGIKGKVFVIACYAPPNLTQNKADELLEFLSDVVAEGKRKFPDCSIVVGGDFNQWPAQDLLQEHPDLTEVQHGATRQGLKIDRSFTNFGRSIKESGILRPLETEDGRKSDHDIAWSRAEFRREPSKKLTYTYREYTEAGAVAFLADLNTQNWTGIYTARGTNSKAESFQAILDELMNKHFKFKTVVRREDDPPWLNAKIKRMIKKRRRVYDREGRSKKWKDMKATSDELCRKRCKLYVERQKETLTAADASRAFFRNVKAFDSKEKPTVFDVRDIFPGMEDLPVAESLADHFSAISNEFQGIPEEAVPLPGPNSIGMLSPNEVVKKLREFKKPKSMVVGDIFPAIVNRAAISLAMPLTHLYNCITLTQEWPQCWKTEFVTPIPKSSAPQTAGDLRNISCTLLFSKVYESFILKWLGQQVRLRNNQYGGAKGSGTEHYLIDLWQKVLENIEDPRAGSLLTSIDYAKAFNRLDYVHCLKCLQAKGADINLVRIVASFLTGRVMRVKVGSALSEPRPVLGGVPQGSLLGVFLFNLSIDDFKAYSGDVVDYSPVENHPLTTPVQGTPADSPVPPEPIERDRRHTVPFSTEPIQVLKYVDDNVINEKINFDTVAPDGAAVKDKHAVRTQNLFRRVTFQAEGNGMRVHAGKTQMMCIAETKSYVPRAHFFDLDGNKISTSSHMKILGFHFSADPDMALQVRDIRRKYLARIWTLRHLGHRGFGEPDLVKVYRTVILPVHDYCSCVFNSSLTQSQASVLERLQAQSLKSIYGYQHSYAALRQMTGLDTLQERRDKRDLKFAQKCLTSDRYRAWFPLNPIERVTRQPLQYKEFRCRTKRLYNLPIFNMRRRLNGKPRMS